MAVSEKHLQLSIGKMTCVNCAYKIEKELNRTDGIIRAGVSYNSGTADIVFDKEKLSRKKIVSVIENLGYTAETDTKQSGTELSGRISMLIIILALYMMLQSMGILNLLAPSRLADTKMGYGMLFVIGLITSVHCIAMCGGINLSQCIPQSAESGVSARRLDTFRPALSYNLGRVCSYTAVGFLLGLAGLLAGGSTAPGVSAFFQGILKIIAGALMIIMGINMLGLFPWLRRFTVRIPGPLARIIGKEKAKSTRPFIVGILNGFMPCGPLQSMWIVALAAGNPLAGALSMFLFSLGTVPLMLGLGSIVSVLGKKFTDKVMTVGAVLIVVLGLAMLSQGGSLSGLLPPDLLMPLIIALGVAGVLLSIPARKPAWKQILKAASLAVVIASLVFWKHSGTAAQSDAASDAGSEVVDGVQVVSSTLTPGRYPNITVQSGIPVRWEIEAPEGSINGCNYRILIRDYDIEYTFHTGKNVIEFTPSGTGTVRYSCWMGMIYGNIFVTDGTEDRTDASGGNVGVPTPSGYRIPADRIAVASLPSGQNGMQEVSIELTEEGFSPAVIVVQRNRTALWNIDVKMETEENQMELLAPFYSTILPLSEGINQLSLSPSESFDVSTGDHRFYCYIKVVDDLSDFDEDAVKAEAAAWETLIYPAEVFERPAMSCCSP